MTSPIFTELYPATKNDFKQINEHVSFHVLESHGLSIEKFEGIIDMETFLDCKRELYKHSSFDNKRHVLMDVRGVAFRMSYEEIQEAISVLHQAFQTFDKRRIAIVGDRPMEVAFGLSVKRIANEIADADDNVCVCALPSNGLGWLLNEEECLCLEKKFSSSAMDYSM